MNEITLSPTGEVIENKSMTMQDALISIVQRKDIDPDRLEKFLNLQILMENRQAEQAFNEAMAKFQSLCPIIKREKKVSFTSKSGSNTNYAYAPLDEIVHEIKPILNECGLSYSFDVKAGPEISILHTTISHIDGHSKTSTYSFPTLHDDTRMNQSQRIKSAITFAKRAGLENALGIVTANEDDDARRATDAPISEAQKKEIQDLLKITKSAESRILAQFNVESLEQLNGNEAKNTIKALKIKRAKVQA